MSGVPALMLNRWSADNAAAFDGIVGRGLGHPPAPEGRGKHGTVNVLQP